MIKRFESRVKKGDGCWEWQGGRDQFGYGMISARGIRDRAHRVSYRLFKGDIPPDLQVLHRCDNPQCANPDHLFVGTITDNMADKVRKGRQLKGENSPGAKLTTEQVKALKAAPPNSSAAAFAIALGVTPSNIFMIWHNRTWRHVAVPDGHPASRTCERGNFITFQGDRLCVRDWERKLGMSSGLLHRRLSAGWSLEKALTTPARRYRSLTPLTEQSIPEAA